MRDTDYTDDPARLAAQLESDFRELAATARGIARYSLHDQRLQTQLKALHHQTMNMAYLVQQADASIDDSRRWGESPQWEVASGTEPVADAQT